MPWNVLIRPGSPGSAPSLRRTRDTQTRRYWRSSRYSGPQTLVSSSVWRTTLPGVRGEVLEEQPLGPRQLDELAVAGDHPALEVDLDVVELEDPGAGLGARRPAEHGAHAGRELVGVERLGDVVVGAEVEALGLVGGRALGGQQDDRDRSPLAQLAHDLDAVEVGHDDVEQDDVGADLLGLGEGLLAAACGDDTEALLAEGDRHELRDAWLVVGDEHERLGAHDHLLIDDMVTDSTRYVISPGDLGAEHQRPGGTGAAVVLQYSLQAHCIRNRRVTGGCQRQPCCHRRLRARWATLTPCVSNPASSPCSTRPKRSRSRPRDPDGATHRTIDLDRRRR